MIWDNRDCFYSNMYFWAVLISLILCALLLGACMPFKPDQRNALPSALPALFNKDAAVNSTAFGGLNSTDKKLDLAVDPWWEGFASAELNQLVETALGQGFSVQEARARLLQVQASAIKSGADLYPHLSGQGSSNHYREKTGPNESKPEGYSTTHSNALGLAGSYEIDLWGRIRSENTAALLDSDSALQDVRTASMTLSGQVVEAWLSILETRKQLEVVENQLKTNQDVLAILEFRFLNSLANALDVLQQRETVAKTRSQLPPLKARERELLNELAYLLGKASGSELAVNTEALPESMPLPDTGIPADLLINRPDIQAAWMDVQAADWRISGARANRLPTISLLAGAQYQGAQLGNIFESWLASLGGSLVAPLLDGGLRAAEVERVRAVLQERLIQYEKIVFGAVQEVENGLTRVERQKELLDALQVQIEAARASLTQAKNRYLSGLIEYNTVLLELLNVQSLEQNLVQARAGLLVYQAGLCRSLGGGWLQEVDLKLKRIAAIIISRTNWHI